MSNFSIVNRMRLPSQDKNYWLNQLETFTKIVLKINSGRVVRIEFGKQDTRGIYAISLYSKNHCISNQKHFETTKELLSFVEGYNEAKSDRALGYF